MSVTKHILAWSTGSKKLYRRIDGVWDEFPVQPTISGTAPSLCVGLPDGSIIVNRTSDFLHWHPTSGLWETKATPVATPFSMGVAVGANCAIAADAAGRVLVYDGSTWSSIKSSDASGNRVWGSALDDIWLIGQNLSNLYIKHWDGSSWSANLMPNLVSAIGWDPGYPTSVWGAGGNVFFMHPVAWNGYSAVTVWNGTGWSEHSRQACPCPPMILHRLIDIWTAPNGVYWCKGDVVGSTNDYMYCNGVTQLNRQKDMKWQNSAGCFAPIFGLDEKSIYAYGYYTSARVWETLDSGLSWSLTTFPGSDVGQFACQYVDNPDGPTRTIHPTAACVLGDWDSSSGNKLNDIAANDGDANFISTSTQDEVEEFQFTASAMPVGRMIMAVRIVAVARSTVAGARLQLSIRRGITSADRRSNVPRESSFELDGTTTYRECVVTFSNLPFPGIHGAANVWPADGSAFDDYCVGVVATDPAGGSIRVTELRLEAIVRPEVTLDEIVASERMQPWQWLEIEGVRYVPTTAALPKECGDYYYGFDYRPLAGIMLANEMFRSGRWNRARGREEFEAARVVLLDVTEIAFEHDANGGEPIVHVFPQGFLTWLLAYGDRERVARRRMLDTSDGWNTLKGLDPQWNDGVSDYGRAFKVEPGASWPTPGDEDSYVYVGRECLWVGEIQTYATYDVLGRADNALKLLRGRFGSSNEAHVRNPVTNVYPEVTDHPGSWNGRWVRVWTGYIDEVTGYPFPMSLAAGRTYLWASHAQELGGNRASHTVSLSSFERALDGPVVAPSSARCRRMALGTHSLEIWAHDIATGEWQSWVASLTTTSYADAGELCSALQAALGTAGLGTYNAFSIAMLGEHVRIRITPQASYGFSMYCSDDLAAALGFEPGETVSEPDGTFDAKDPAATVFIAGAVTYTEEGDTDEWPAGYPHEIDGRIPGTASDYAVLVLASGDQKIVRRCMMALKGSDGNGSFVNLGEPGPDVLEPYLPDDLTVRSTGGEAPPSLRRGLVAVDVAIHEFFLRALTSTGFGVNGAHDLWPRGFGLGIRADLIDLDAWELVGERVKMRRSWCILDAIKVSELLDEELSYPHGIMLRQDLQGRLQLTIAAPPATSDGDARQILNEHWTSRLQVRVEHSARNVVNHVVVEIDEDPIDGKFRTKLEALEPNSIDLYGEQLLRLKHRGERLQYLGHGLGAGSPGAYFPALCDALFRRFSFERPVISGAIGKRGLAMSVGEGVYVEHDLLADPSNRDARGFSARPAVLLKVDKNEVSGRCEIELQCDRMVGRHGGFAPAAEVQSWDSGTKTITCYQHSFSDANDPIIDSMRFAAGDKARLVQANSSAPSYSDVEVASVDGRDVILTASPSFTPVAGDWLIWGAFDALTSSQRGAGYVAISSDGHVDSGDTVDGWEYAP